MRILTVLTVFLFAAPSFALFSEAEHCVAWKTRKTMGMFKKVNPVGKNCSIETKMVKAEDGKFFFEGAFPLNRFDSGESDRDKEVIKILNGQKQMMLVFKSEPKEKSEWQKLMALGGGEIAGSLTIAGQSFSIKPKIEVKREGRAFKFKGQLLTNFNTFKVKPPKIAMGLVAKVHDYLELHYQFQAKKVDGLKSVFAQE